jgi:Beta-lactamase class C and other penicillin binding proteins
MKIYFATLIMFITMAVSITCAGDKKNSGSSDNLLTAAKEPEEAGFSGERLNRIDAYLKKNIENGILPHAQAFIARHGKIIYNKSFGWKDVDKKIALQDSDIFRLASQTKAITSTALMMLYEEGKFLLDDPVSKYIPEFKNPKVKNNLSDNAYSINPPNLRSEITIRNLLSHTSGIPYYESSVFDNMTIGLTMEDKTLAEEIHKLAKLPLDHKPGTGFTYGYSVDVIGYLVELFSGMSLNDFFKKRIFEPLGMNDTYFYLPDDKADRLVTLYEKENSQSKLKVSSDNLFQNYPVKGAKKFYSGGAGLSGTLKDYAKFCQMLLNKGTYNGKEYLSAKTVELMTVNHIGDLKLWDSGNKFGLGFEIITDEGLKNVLGSAGSYKWGGAFGTEYIIDPKEDMVLIFYCNVMPFEEKTEILNKYRILVYQDLNKE